MSVQLALPGTWNAGATVSSCEMYRYALWRDWDASLGRVCWVMLNPSTADAEEDDPTIRRCVNFSAAWGYGGIVVVNLYAFRATRPHEMLAEMDPVGPANDETIIEVLDSGLTKLVVCAWGNHAPRERADAVVALLRRRVTPHALRFTKSGAPQHPLYLPGDLVPSPWGAP